jgi:para-aminobenzoate synthetase component 1
MLVHELKNAPEPASACEAFLDVSGCALLESGGAHGELSRHSFLTADPFLRLESKDGLLTWWDASQQRSERGDPFGALERELARWRLEAASDRSWRMDVAAADRERAGRTGARPHPPFRGGVLGYFAYDLLHHLERVPPPPFDDLRLPDLDLGFYDLVIAWDHAYDRTWIFSSGFPAPAGAARARRAEERLAWALGRLRGADRRPRTLCDELDDPGTAALALSSGAPSFRVPEVAPNLTSTFSPPGYLDAVARAREYILAGDVFQVNLSQRLSIPCDVAPYDLYRRIRSANPAPFSAFLAAREATVLSASPERFLRVAGDEVETRPIKGTTGRGYTPLHDLALQDDLGGSPKDRAENVMIVDLLRNDLSRVAVEGTVRVPQLCRVERHPTVHHLVSTVTARLRPGLTAIDVLRAAFPGGSITGAPKVRAMEIIHELEPTRRGVYCGSIGYIGFDGAADLSIAIRTLVLKDGIASFSVGGAVVADSDPFAEYRETLLKGAGLLRAWDAAADARAV